MPRIPMIVVENGLSAGLTLKLEPESANLVGRSPDAALCLHADEVSVSRRHCMLDVASGEVQVKNLQDPERTCVNGEPVAGAAPLRPGDRLTVGSVVLRLLAAPSNAGVDAENLELSISEVEDVSDAPAHLGPELARFARGAPLMAAPAHDTHDAPVARAQGCDGCGREDAARVDPDHASSPWLCESCAKPRRSGQASGPVLVGPYEIFGKLGEGGMGTVYEGIDTGSRVRVAVKVLRPDRKPSEKDVQRFVREQGIALTLRHPNILRCFQVGAQNGLFFIASEFVSGGDATGLIGTASVNEVVGVGVDLFRALAHAHAQGVVHRDVKPANILVTDKTRPRRGRLMDFGLAKNVKDMNNRLLTAQGEAGGTLSMMSPEQLLNFAGASWPADVYSGAATMYRMLTGADAIVLPPSAAEGDFAKIAAAVLSSARRPLRSVRAELPEGLCTFIDRILARDEAFRSALSATQVADALSGFAT